MGYIFFTLLTQPMINILTFLYHIIPDLGIGIILLTLIIKVILFPLNWKSIKYQKEMKTIQEKVNDIKTRVTDKEQQAIEVMNLYKKEKINPFSSCLPLILQLVVLIALIKALNGFMVGHISASSITYQIKDALYPFISNLVGDLHIKYIAFNILDLTKKAVDGSNYNLFGIGLAVIAGAAQFFQTKMMTPATTPNNANPDDKETQLTGALNKQMLYIFPALTVWMGLSFPMGITLYWVVSTIFSIIQQAIILHMHKDNKPGSNNRSDKQIIEIQKAN